MVRGRHRANQGPDLLRDSRRSVAALPRPEEAKPVPMPPDVRFGFDDDERRKATETRRVPFRPKQAVISR